MIFFFVFHVILVVLAIIGSFEYIFDQQLKESRISGKKEKEKITSHPKTESILVVPIVASNISEQAIEAVRLMQNFVEVLQEFVNGTIFDFISFESKMKALGEQLAHITVSVTNISPCKQLAENLSAVKNFYDVMTESTESMRRHQKSGVAVIQWLPKG
ncbi:hypothetical protein HF325_001016 [Metschnikowia pulcherrima]|uniref:Uncharacterized protein n=1 Tax=Metschnikowia pulcherrima TaxID=27326 RepID=A0A8H7GXG8_9ASCO|nr:hypothetical protein HF325_001016 [Metschnikowia pulcherrima]